MGSRFAAGYHILVQGVVMNYARKSGLLLTAFSLVALPAPVLAEVDMDFAFLGPEADGACDAALNPNENSGFKTYALSVSSNSTSVTSDDPSQLTTTSGYGIATTTFANFVGAHQNGQSVNIHAYGDRTVVYAQTLITVPRKTVTTTTYTASCHTHKPFQNGGNDNDVHQLGGVDVKYNSPNGLQISHQGTYQTIETAPAAPRTVISEDDFVDPVASQNHVEVVICISPGKVPGSWRYANNYNGNLGNCPTLWTQIHASTPSVSVPAS